MMMIMIIETVAIMDVLSDGNKSNDNNNDKENMKNKTDQHWGAPHTAADTQRLAPAPPQRGDQARPDHTHSLWRCVRLSLHMRPTVLAKIGRLVGCSKSVY